MITLEDLGMDPVARTTDDHGTTADASPKEHGLPPLVAGDIATRALIHAWHGDPTVIVESPPGAGKSTLLAIVASHLQVRAQLTVAIACQRVNQAIELASKIANLAPAAAVTCVTASGTRLRPDGLADSVEHQRHMTATDHEGARIVVATTAKFANVAAGDWSADVLLVDEAWQLRFADWGRVAHIAPQYVLVGDPGQIAPVTTCATRRWRASGHGPHTPAPIALRSLRGGADDIVDLRLPNTRRCGPATAHALQPLYPFAFGSGRYPRHLLLNGTQAPEFAVRRVGSDAVSQDDPAVADAIAAAVHDLLDGGEYRDETGATRPLAPSDIGVVTAHVDQAAAVERRLVGVPGVTVGTADSLQGGEWLATVVWAPPAGVKPVIEFDLDPGRLCVAISRHVTHCIWVERDDTRTAVAAADSNARQVYLDVLDRLDEGC